METLENGNLKYAHLDQAIKENFQVGAVTYIGARGG
jgi:hypothetical protein